MSLLSEVHLPAPFAERLRLACAVSPSLIADAIGEACRQFASQERPATTERVQQLIRVGAWTDAALALIELELPQWQVRRLAYDDGEWCCALSRERELPDWLDASVESRHADLALAILSAFVEVQRHSAASPQTSVPRAPQGANALYEPLLSDNFG